VAAKPPVPAPPTAPLAPAAADPDAPATPREPIPFEAESHPTANMQLKLTRGMIELNGNRGMSRKANTSIR